MITPAQFVELLAHSEGQALDFKRDPYDLSDEEGRGALIKDILSMANTPRTGPGHIVLGVKAHADRPSAKPCARTRPGRLCVARSVPPPSSKPTRLV